MTSVAKSLSPSLLRNNFAWATFGTGIYLASQWLLIMILAKLGNPAMVGKFAFGSAIATPVIVFSQMNLRHSLVTDIKGDFHFLDCLYSRLIFTLVALFVILLITWISQNSFEMFLITGLIGMAKSFESISDIIHGKFQKDERMEFIAISLMLKGFLNVLIFGLLVWLFRDLFWPLISMVAVWGGILWGYDIPRYRELKNLPNDYSWKFSVFKQLFWTTFPLSLNSVFGSISGNMPRYFLEYYGSKESVGLFAVASAPLNFITLFQTSLMQAIMHRLAFYYQKDDQNNFKRLSLKALIFLLAIGAFFTLLFAFGGEYLIEILFSREYVSVASVLVLMSAGATLNTLGTYFIFSIVVGRRFYSLAAISFISLIGQYFISIFLIKNYGVIGAGLADLSKTTLTIAICFLFRHKPSSEARCSKKLDK